MKVVITESQFDSLFIGKKVMVYYNLHKHTFSVTYDSKVIMYDDSIPNLDSFIKLKKEYPNSKFYAWNVSLDGDANEYERTNEEINNIMRREP